MQKCYSSSAVLYYMRNTKLLSNYRLHFSRVVKVPRPLCFSIYRIICTDIRTQNRLQPKYEFTTAQESYCVAPFLKENFNIIENRYFKLISVSNEHHLRELLKKEELKEVISRSPFTFDVKISDSLCNNYFKQCSFNAFEDVNKDLTFNYVKKTDHFEELTLFSTSKQNDNSGKPTEQQLLHIIDKLTFSLLNFFEKPQEFSFYHKDIIFQNNINGIITRGLTAYIQTMYILKFYGFIHFAKVKVEILKITHHIDAGSVKVRWRVNGISRRRQLVNLWKQKKISVPPEETEWVDGLSTFSVDSDGLIYQHVCDKITPDNSDATVKKPDMKTKLLRLLEIPRPRPISLHAFVCYSNNQDFSNCKKIT